MKSLKIFFTFTFAGIIFCQSAWACNTCGKNKIKKEKPPTSFIEQSV